jgi:hypothetical protein
MRKPSLTIRPAKTGVRERIPTGKERKPVLTVTLSLDEDEADKAWKKVVKRFIDTANEIDELDIEALGKRRSGK